MFIMLLFIDSVLALLRSTRIGLFQPEVLMDEEKGKETTAAATAAAGAAQSTPVTVRMMWCGTAPYGTTRTERTQLEGTGITRGYKHGEGTDIGYDLHVERVRM